MRARHKLIISVILILILLTGCSIEMISMPELPELDMGTSTLEGSVESVDGLTCKVLITVGDSHFDAEDEIQLTYTNLEGSNSISVGDTVTFEYDYNSQVSEHLGSPHITVNLVHVN